MMEHSPYSLDFDTCFYKHRLYGEFRSKGCHQWYAEKAAIRLAYESFCETNKFNSEILTITKLEEKAIKYCLSKCSLESITYRYEQMKLLRNEH